MNSIKFQHVLLGALIPAVFTVINLITLPNHTDYVWINIGSIWLFYFLAFLPLVLNKTTKRQVVLNWTLGMCSFVCFIIGLIVSLFFLYISVIKIQWAISIYLLLFICFVTLFTIIKYTNQQTEEHIFKQHAQKNLINEWKYKVDLLQESSPTPELKQLSDLLYISPINSSIVVNELENEISSKIDELPDSCLDIIQLLKKRNLTLKRNN